ncbi:high mobility group box domain-containing protein [Phycomyces nitens]|nr:high mobility group box domain-containing protein [Phycomyces nitens]
MTQDKLRDKYRELKKRIRDMESENEVLQVRIHKARRGVRQLKLERTVLLDRMERHQGSFGDSEHYEIGSDNGSQDESFMIKYDHGKHMDKIIGNHAKAPRKKKDPNAPKGPGNVFFVFCRFERDKIKDENPQESLGDVTRLLGLKWKSLSKEEKQVYYDMYKKESDDYEVAMKTYTSGVVGFPDLLEESTASSPAMLQEPLLNDPHPQDYSEDAMLMGAGEESLELNMSKPEETLL